MAIQHATTTRNRLRDGYVAAFPAGAVLSIRTGAPAGVGGAAGGTQLAAITLPTTPLTSGTGQVTLNGTWSVAATAAGTARSYRLTNGSDIEEGDVFQAVNLTTTAITAANGNVLTFAATTGVVVGMTATGTGIPAGATVLAVAATTVTLSLASSAGVASGAAIAFGGDITLDNTNIAIGQNVSITSWTRTMPAA